MKITSDEKKYTCYVEHEKITYVREEYDSFDFHWIKWKFWKDADWHILDNGLEREIEREFRKTKKNKIRKDKLDKIENV